MGGEKRRRPSIFDMIERYMERMDEEMSRFFPFEKGILPSRRSFDIDEFLRDPFEEIMRRFEEEIPEELRSYIREEDTPEGKVRKYGPFIYGFTYTIEPGKEPEIKEFGNIRPGYRRIETFPEGEREPLVDVMELKDAYEVIVELPGVEKGEIKLDATDDSLEIKTTGERKFYKKVDFDKEINPDSAKATYKNGVLSVKVEKKEKEKKKKTISLE